MNYPKIPPKPKLLLPSTLRSTTTGQPQKTHPADTPTSSDDTQFPSVLADTHDEAITTVAPQSEEVSKVTGSSTPYKADIKDFDTDSGTDVESKESSSVVLPLNTTEMASDVDADTTIKEVSMIIHEQESSTKMQGHSKGTSASGPNYPTGVVAPISGSPVRGMKSGIIRPCVPPPPPPTKQSLDSGEDGSPTPKNNDKVAMKPDPEDMTLELSPELSELELDEGNKESQESVQIKVKDQKFLAPQVFLAEHKNPPSKSMDVYYEEVLASGESRRPPVYVKSFSVEETDLVYKGKRLDTSRPLSAEYDMSCIEPQRDRKMNTKSEAGIGGDISSIEEEPLYAEVYEAMTKVDSSKTSYVNKECKEQLLVDQQLVIRQGNDDNEGEANREFEGFDGSWSSDEFDSDSFTGDSTEEMEKDEVLPVEKQVTDDVKRQQIATELLTTERAYVKRLHLIDQVFHFKTVNVNRSHRMFPDDVIPQIFSNIKSIYQFHNDFLLPQLEKRLADWDSTPRIGDLMSKFAPFLKLYSEYVKNFDHAIKTINKWQQRSTQFADLIADVQKRPECGQLSLQHHMLEPIQRVPRYELLLKNYLRHLEGNSEDRPDTEKALELVTTAAAHANKTTVKPERFHKMLELNRMFGGVVDLTDRPRELIKEGKIFKISARDGTLYTRYLFLFTDRLLVCGDHSMHGRYHVHNILKVDTMQVVEGDNPERPFTFYVETDSKIIELQCRTQEEKAEWFSTIETMVREYKGQHMFQESRGKMEKFQERLEKFHKMRERFHKMLELNRMFGGAVDLTDRPRELIKDGQIFKVSARDGTLYTRYLFLFTDRLLVCGDHSMHGRYHVHNILKVDTMQVLEGDNPERPFSFYVETDSKIIELQGRTQEEKVEWFTTIDTVVREYRDQHMLQQSREKMDQRLGHRAPRWVKDQNTSMCMACASAFSIIKRRHHCRCCGIVVCRDCSFHKAPLPYQDNKPGRVCDKCHGALKLQTNELQVKGNDPSVVSGMMMMSSDKKVWKRRWFALHENSILYSFRAPQDIHAMTATRLSGFMVMEATEGDHTEQDRVIKVHNTDTKHVYYFQLDNNTAYTKWLTALQCASNAEIPPDYVPRKRKAEDRVKISLQPESLVDGDSDC